MNELNNKTKVVILTKNFRVEGTIAHFPDARLTDYMIETKNFIAVTNAEVMHHDGTRIFSASFLNIHRDHIEIIAQESVINDRG